jgi:hypothetical protein
MVGIDWSLLILFFENCLARWAWLSTSWPQLVDLCILSHCSFYELGTFSCESSFFCFLYTSTCVALTRVCSVNSDRKTSQSHLNTIVIRPQAEGQITTTFVATSCQDSRAGHHVTCRVLCCSVALLLCGHRAGCILHESPWYIGRWSFHLS